jgi:hypothetical protein
MIRCICIDDRDRPADFPLSKWVKDGEAYHINFAQVVLPQGIIAFQLEEIDLDESCYPYQYFAGNRFVIDARDKKKLERLVMDCADANKFFNFVTTS